ncbi:restriction endonuclease [Pseudomonas ficuserectae]|uniref:restriction endonuclease n=1 Tax=Pseudomonas syringae group genomosp. 2 TaxID=251698 RepID=UPI0006996E4B|nr:restriction endonuclease [Pseudomonas amygdali]ARA79645.1 restriction endonuclease [Pseudomonas amygdali pv. lachrymans]RMP43170.1 hypothetical protein ALQ26_04306 [Pseudomonas amygdali pv. lachrymans]WIO59428.1 restriction endonuclease [Pseudomonas amygdali pv. lachrymans]
MAGPGIEFELLVKSIYEEILEQDQIETLEIQHNVSLMGRSGQKHQIDVFWKFRIAGVEHKVAVECKDYSGTVSVGKIRDFWGALEDVGNIHGIFVTRVGFQSGAVTFAEHKGISLKTIREPTEEDIAEHGGISGVEITGHLHDLINVSERLVFDTEWMAAHTDLKKGDAINISGMSNELLILDQNKSLLGSIHDFQNSLPREPENSQALTKSFEFDHAYIRGGNPEYPDLKIKALTFTYDTQTHITKTSLRYKTIAAMIIKDFITGEAHLFRMRKIPTNL